MIFISLENAPECNGKFLFGFVLTCLPFHMHYIMTDHFCASVLAFDFILFVDRAVTSLGSLIFISLILSEVLRCFISLGQAFVGNLL